MAVCEHGCPSGSACQGACYRRKAARPLTFWHVAGDIIWRGGTRCTPITEEMARDLRDFFEEQARAAFLARDITAAKRAANHWTELGNALDALTEWRRIVGRTVAPLAPAGSAVADVVEAFARRRAS